MWTSLAALAALALVPPALAQDDPAPAADEEEEDDGTDGLRLRDLIDRDPAPAGEAEEEAPPEEEEIREEDIATELPDFEFSTTGKWKDGEIEPRLLMDNSAYTIGRNNWLISPTRVEYGLFDNVQIGTNLLLDVFEIYNIKGKINAIQTKRFDASFETAYYQPGVAELLDISNLYAQVFALEWRASVMVFPRWSVHGGQTWYLANVGGNEFGLGTVAVTLGRLFGADLGEQLEQELEKQINDATSNTTLSGGLSMSLRRNYFVTDLRLNRRDQIIFGVNALTQARGSIIAGADTSADIIGEDTSLGLTARFNLPASEILTTAYTIAWQFNWEHFHLRLGITPTTGQTNSGTAIFNTFTEGIQTYWIF